MIVGPTDPVAEKLSAHFKELALSLYHAMGCAIWHKVIFLNEACHQIVTEALINNAACMENRQLRVVLKYVVQRYVLNIPRICFSTGHSFLMAFCQHLRTRQEWMTDNIPSSLDRRALDVEYRAAELSGNALCCFQSENLFNVYIYRKSGISAHFHQSGIFTAEQIEEARAAIVIGTLPILYVQLIIFIISTIAPLLQT